jgi:hypothetical protein
MLKPEEIFVGSLNDAEPLSLMLPRCGGEPTILIGGAGDQKTAFFLDGDHKFNGFKCNGNTAYEGLIVIGVSIEVDEGSAFDQSRADAQLGSLIRKDDVLGMFMRIPNVGTRVVPLITGLAKARERHSAGFNRWTVGLGHGQDRRVLIELDIPARRQSADL